MNTRPLTPIETAAYIRRYSRQPLTHLRDVARIVGIDTTGKTRREIAQALTLRTGRLAATEVSSVAITHKQSAG